MKHGVRGPVIWAAMTPRTYLRMTAFLPHGGGGGRSQHR